jgi:hypothetical protein
MLPVPFPPHRNIPGMNEPSDRLQFGLQSESLVHQN